MNSNNIFSVIVRIFNRRLYSTRIADIYANKMVDINVNIKGWVKHTRIMKTKIFIDIDDGSSFRIIQTVIPKNLAPEHLGNGSSVEIFGKLTMLKTGQIEVQAESIKLIGTCNFENEDRYPFIPKKNYTPPDLREFLHFRPRSKIFASLLRIRNKASMCVHDFFQREKFVNIHAPILTSNDCEGAGEIFQVIPESKRIIEEMKEGEKTVGEVFFDRNVFLTVSSQLHLETAARALCNVYQFGPTFRAENSKSRLHLSEFYMIEAEVSFLNDIEDLLNLMEKFIKQITQDLLTTHEEEIIEHRNLLKLPSPDCSFINNVLNRSFTIMSFDDACTVLNQNSKYLKQPLTNHRHFSKEHELFLIKHNDGVPIFVINWPEDKKPFYVKATNSISHVAAVDLLFPEVGELCGGSLREDNYDLLKHKLIKHDLHEKLNWYLDLRKFGNVPTGGFGMGFERYLKVLLGLSSIKDTIPFPRWPHNCKL